MADRPVNSLDPKATVRVLGSRVDGLTRREFRAVLVDALAADADTSHDRKPGLRVSKLNTEFLLRARRDPEFARTLEGSHVNIPDGRGVLWAAHFLGLPVSSRGVLGAAACSWQALYTLVAMVLSPRSISHPLPENIPGTDAFSLALDAASSVGAPIFVFGGRASVLDLAVARIARERPELRVAGARHGYDFVDGDIVDAVNQSGATVLFVALGSPAQERWIEHHLPQMPNVRVAIGEGGTLDFVAGEAPHAPQWMRRSGLEWAWRLATSPSRTGGVSRLRRVWDAVPVFILAVVGDKIRALGEVTRHG